MTPKERQQRIHAQSARMAKIVNRLHRQDNINYALDYWDWLMKRCGAEPQKPERLSPKDAQKLRARLKSAVDPEL